MLKSAPFSSVVSVCVCCHAPESLSSALGPVALGLLQTLAGRFSLLCHLTGQHAASLTNNLRRGRDVKGLVVLDHASIFLDAYHEYVFLIMNPNVYILFKTTDWALHICLFINAKVLQCRGQLPGDGRIPDPDQTFTVSTINTIPCTGCHFLNYSLDNVLWLMIRKKWLFL